MDTILSCIILSSYIFFHSEEAGLKKWEKYADYEETRPTLAERFKKAAEADDTRAEEAKQRFAYHQDQLQEKEKELEEAKANYEKAKAKAEQSSMVGCSDGEMDDDEVEEVLAGRRTLKSLGSLSGRRGNNGQSKGKATGAATGATAGTAATAKADQNKTGRTITGSGEGADDDGDNDESELFDDDDNGISPIKAVKKEALLSHDMNYATENNAEYEYGKGEYDPNADYDDETGCYKM